MKSFAPLLRTKHKIAFLALDVLLFVTAVFVATTVRLGESPSEFQWLELSLLAFLVPIIQYIFGNYDLDHISGLKQLLVRQGMAFGLTALAATAITFVFSTDRVGLFGRGALVGSLVLFLAFSMSYRLAVTNFFKSVKGRLKWLILADDHAREVIDKDFADLNFEGRLEFYNPDHDAQELNKLLQSQWNTLVIASREKILRPDISALIIEAKCAGTNAVPIADFYERHLRKVPLHLLDYHWFINSEGFSSVSHPIQLRLKRLMDIAISGLLLLLASPVIALVALVVKLESRGPAIYSQIRTGKDGETFTIFKFRSMRTDAEKNGAVWAAKNDNRVTRIGRFIRLTRLDELPQLWNVLKGEMSFVGPRPERPEFNEMLKAQLPYYDLRHTLRPGLTGWAQVLYPYGASIEDSKEKLQFELYYIKHSSIFLDIMIILKTIAVVVGARGR
ncbi:exopolysaccharide biosynthesis polyprenyl glycosylphosphotransferase [Bdellovibrio sp. HCB288]|uniref:exopolysaccharide biosynthesis polyprenyl glycosylphosphotransferase n=1 Tax=Bdellovibrio sp. HCB288 TaxID=3394355 RepID=UPI0039B53907